MLVLQEFESTIFSVYCDISLWEGVSESSPLWLSCSSEWLLVEVDDSSGLPESVLEPSSSLLDPVPVSVNISFWEGVSQ